MKLLENGSFSCPFEYFVRYSLDILKKKTKVLDIFNKDKKNLMKFYIESSPQELWVRIWFMEIN